MTSDEWLALAERCEKEQYGCRDIDDAIALAAGIVPEEFTNHKQQVSGAFWNGKAVWETREPVEWKTPEFTTSVDAITALIDAEFPGFFLSILGRRGKSSASIQEVDFGAFSEPCATEALARCAVFCRAMSEKVKNND